MQYYYCKFPKNQKIKFYQNISLFILLICLIVVIAAYKKI